MTLMTAYLNEVEVEKQILILLCIYLRFAAKNCQALSGHLSSLPTFLKWRLLLQFEREAEHGDKGAKGYACAASFNATRFKIFVVLFVMHGGMELEGT